MRKVDDQIRISNQLICRLIDEYDAHDRGFMSQNILNNLRTFVEAVAVKVTGQSDYSYEIFKFEAKDYIAATANLIFLSRFHQLLQKSKSHFATDEEASERLMLKYYENLLKIKLLLKNSFGIDVLTNIYKFPLNTDRTLSEYYQEISAKIKQPPFTRQRSDFNERFYIQKIKPFFVNHEIFYEVTYRIADDKLRKFDRLIAYTQFDITENYAVKLSISNDFILISGRSMPIQIIDSWQVSIRPCELKNFERIFKSHATEYSKTREYDSLMNHVTNTGLNFVEIVDLSDKYYSEFRNKITKEANTERILNLLDETRKFIRAGYAGKNIIRYLLYTVNNRVLKSQFDVGRNRKGNHRLSGLNLSYKCIPFEEMPFATSPVSHNPNFSVLFNCLDTQDREHELLARHITNNAEVRGWLYTPIKNLEHFENLSELIDVFNKSLYQGSSVQRDRALEVYKNHIYISGYENSVVEIIRKLKDLSDSGVRNYLNSINVWLDSAESDVDCEQKAKVLREMFAESKVSLIYGAAGTGKTKLIEHISKYHNELSKLYLANTHSAIGNLKSRISAQNTEFRTIKSFLNAHNNVTEFDILIIDECSVISNSDMCNILKKASYGALILVGDVFQIESIRFGNWFYIVQNFVPRSSVVELTTPWRAQSNDLLNLWNKVRNLEEDIDEYTVQNGYSTRLDDSIFKQSENDEIILCLNYDGVYGINNVNRFLQENNQSEPVKWGVNTYKAGDPILFNESNRFSPMIHNNLKGKILAIVLFDGCIQFTIEIDKSLSELDVRHYDDLNLLDSIDTTKSVIQFKVNSLKSTDEDDDDLASDIVPFQVAYAVSIHKAQGLEYDSVKVVITAEAEERISHNIFYTAITRARRKLKIYWTPETQKKVIGSLEQKFNQKDIHLLRSKFSL